jgi:hypothetical protein
MDQPLSLPDWQKVGSPGSRRIGGIEWINLRHGVSWVIVGFGKSAR